MTEYFGDRPVCYFGPLAPPPQEEELNRKELTQTAEPDEVEVFMERVLKEKGEKSLLYVCSEVVVRLFIWAYDRCPIDIIWFFLFDADRL